MHDNSAANASLASMILIKASSMQRYREITTKYPVLETCKQLKIFQKVPPKGLLVLVSKMTPLVMEVGDTLVRAGDKGQDMFVVQVLSTCER